MCNPPDVKYDCHEPPGFAQRWCLHRDALEWKMVFDWILEGKLTGTFTREKE